MAFLELCIYPKAPTWSAECDKCGATFYAHPDTGLTESDLRAGTAECPHCASGHPFPETIRYEGSLYAGRYSANGYLDCTDWSYGRNLRTLTRELCALYGEG